MRHGFHDDDGIVDDNPDREDDAEQGRKIDCKTECGHSGEGADNCDWNRGRRDEHCPKILQEDQDHDEDENACLIERRIDLVDGSLDEDRRVVGDIVFEVRREAARKLLHLRRDFLAHLQRIGLR